jgi:hypothetical protein
MHPALKAALHRIGTLLLATAAGGALQPGRVAQAAVGTEQQAMSPAEQDAWSAAQRADTAVAYQRYLELFPMGAHMEEAFRRIVERSLNRAPNRRLVDIEPALGPPGDARSLSVAAASLSLY